MQLNFIVDIIITEVKIMSECTKMKCPMQYDKVDENCDKKSVRLERSNLIMKNYSLTT